MDLKKGVLLLFFGFIQHILGKLSCHDSMIPIGTNASISCYSDRKIMDFYWYKGDVKHNDIIGSLEHGNILVSEKFLGYYDINQFGEMLIINATIKHESYYTLATFDSSGIPEEDELIVNVTVTPHPPCPKINVCPPCKECQHVADRTGSLTCSITESRPQITLRWLTVSNQGFSFHEHLPTTEGESIVNTWNTSVKISFEAFSCNQDAVLECIAQDHLNMLESFVTSVRISGNCTADNTVRHESSGAVIYIAIIAVAVTITLLGFIVVFFQCNGKRVDVSAENSRTEMPMEVIHLVSCLRKSYEAECTLRPIPWLEPVSVDIVYTNCQCKITGRNADSYETSSERLLADEYITQEKRMLITGNIGYGKTMLSKQFVQRWSQQEKHDFILIFISLKDIIQSQNVAAIVKENLLMESEFDIEDIENIIKQYKCLLLLDGLQEMSLCSEETTIIEDEFNPQCGETSTGDISDDQITIRKLLNGNMKANCNDIRVWVTSRPIKNLEKLFLNYNLEINLNGFSKSHVKAYISKSRSLYINSKDQSINEASCRNDVDHSGDQYTQVQNDRITAEFGTIKYEENNVFEEVEKGANKTEVCVTDRIQTESLPLLEKEKTPFPSKVVDYTDEMDSTITDICFSVYELLEKNDFLNAFNKTPHLLFLIIQISLAKYLNNTSQLKDVSLRNSATLIGCVITCLEEKYRQENDRSTCLSQKESDMLKVKLGEMAFQALSGRGGLNFEDISCQFPTYHDYLKTALDIGLLHKTHPIDPVYAVEDNESVSISTGVVFCHPFLRDYFAACSVGSNSKHFEILIDTLKNDDQNRFVGVLKFSSLFENSLFSRLCDVLREKSMHTNIVDCLYERNGDEETQQIIRKLSRDRIIFTHLRSYYHQEAVKTFCRSCKKLKISLKFIAFTSDCPFSFLRNLELPDLRNLAFFSMDFSEEDFVKCLHWVHEINVTATVRFVKCNLPTTFSAQYRNEVKTLKVPGVKVYRLKESDSIVAESFNYNTGKWTYI